MACQWTVLQVQEWLEENGFEAYTELFCNKHKIDGSALMMLDESDLKNPPLKMEVLGDIKRLSLLICCLQRDNDVMLNGNPSSSNNKFKRQYRREISSVSSWSEEFDGRNTTDTSKESHTSHELDSELWKTALSFIYVFTVFLISSVVLVIVHDQVPDMEKYPPLPDLVLDNVPLIPKAFEICELTIVTLGTVWGLILVVHKHRFILLRRYFSLMGTVFLLRCVTMLITSLSVPGVHLNCKPRQNTDFASQFWHAVEIWKGLGMSLQGVRSCGDYMFSGHTVCLTLFNFFITEYTPRRLFFLHTFSWVLNLFGIFFILAAHEHYSIDVFIAFYISTRLFLYYHTLANNRVARSRDYKRTRVYFPLFAFFESKCNGAVPNEFEWPLPWPESFKVYFKNHKKIL